MVVGWEERASADGGRGMGGEVRGGGVCHSGLPPPNPACSYEHGKRNVPAILKVTERARWSAFLCVPWHGKSL
ncbi:hypothetical protein F751_4507 [Auxenochlorella protothecoides]|uniref:Uncharacterized protein n=1 Tax=Auxenochlorella protothecoides TaxID=3075 RepID=A0A087SND3_AUXPR|nr:hypothetical protein F751_4507 [Auxenochlorella protothecoides]KFM27237.1 hypothetical protein F751_4507 [Auxenochlorella protothecoides]